MKVNLIKKLDSNKLDKALEDFNYEYSAIPKYIIMNNETADALIGVTKFKYATWLDAVSKKNTIFNPTYNEIPIAICGNLNYGEIEIV